MRKNALFSNETVKRITDQIRDDLQLALMAKGRSIGKSIPPFPVYLSNDLGKFKIEADGTVYIQPKKTPKYISIDININLGETE